jgi:hypothetical protein
MPTQHIRTHLHLKCVCVCVTVVSQWCHSGVTVVLQWCHSGVTVVLQWCYSGVTVVLQDLECRVHFLAPPPVHLHVGALPVLFPAQIGVYLLRARLRWLQWC